jgi:hypothetical protein
VSGYIVKKNDGVIGVWQKRWFVDLSGNNFVFEAQV